MILNREVGQYRALHCAEALESQGVVVINSKEATRMCGDKWLTSSTLDASGLPTPPTALAFCPSNGTQAVSLIGYPAVVKPIVGSWGRLVTKVSQQETAEAVMEHLEALPHPSSHLVYVQKAIPNPGYDLRILVVGGRAVAGSRRSSSNFRTNVARGAISTPLELTPEVSNLAVAASSAVGADIAGVDLIEENDGKLWIIEVNDRVEFKGLQDAHSNYINIADAIIDFILETKELPT